MNLTGKGKIMLIDLFRLLLSLTIILFCCELFTNSIEWLGKKLNLGDGVTGSILSAVGTCLPETIIPVIAILFNDNSSDIGVGAILGAPFMLGTLAFFLTGLSVIVFRKKRKTGMVMKVNCGILRRDIGFFIFIYTIGISACLIQMQNFKYYIAAFLAACYVVYIMLTVKSDRRISHDIDPLYLGSFLHSKPHMPLILLQLGIALFGIIVGAETFVKCIEAFADMFNISKLALSLIIAPIATELPEKFNSIIWISKKKDTLALGNITGAMVFQSCIPVSIGIAVTPWILEAKALVSAVLALMSAILVYLWLKFKNKLSPVPLLAGGLFYALFISYLVITGF